MIQFYDALSVSYERPTSALYSWSSHRLHVFTDDTEREGLGEQQPRGGGPAHLLVGNLQQLQHHGVRAHVPQQALLLLPALPHRRALLNTEFAQPNQNLSERKSPSVYL